MNKFLLPLCLAFAATPVLAQAPTPLDGEWRGRSDGGSCNAPLEYVIFIESGLVDGSATDATARGPVPNTRKGPPPRTDARPVADPRAGEARLVLADRRRLGEGHRPARRPAERHQPGRHAHRHRKQRLRPHRAAVEGLGWRATPVARLLMLSWTASFRLAQVIYESVES